MVATATQLDPTYKNMAPLLAAFGALHVVTNIPLLDNPGINYAWMPVFIYALLAPIVLQYLAIMLGWITSSVAVALCSTSIIVGCISAVWQLVENYCNYEPRRINMRPGTYFTGIVWMLAIAPVVLGGIIIGHGNTQPGVILCALSFLEWGAIWPEWISISEGVGENDIRCTLIAIFVMLLLAFISPIVALVTAVAAAPEYYIVLAYGIVSLVLVSTRFIMFASFAIEWKRQPVLPPYLVVVPAVPPTLARPEKTMTLP